MKHRLRRLRTSLLPNSSKSSLPHSRPVTTCDSTLDEHTLVLPQAIGSFISTTSTMSNLTKVGIPLVLVLGIVFQIWLRPLLFVTFGIGREMQPISDFSSYQCRRIKDPRLQACEDMWLSESTRQLFLACSDPMSRVQWVPK